MPDEFIETVIQRAREALSLSGETPGRSVYVARLDRPGSGYYLVIFGAEDATVGVAAVDAARGELIGHARLPGSGPHLPVTAEDASRYTGAAATGTPRLVWRPCKASYSMLSPFWEVATLTGPIYIDQQGYQWTLLESGGPGG